jgi:hypothetical protein
MPSPTKHISYDASIFTVRFQGRNFDTRGVNIYDLGHVLVTFQRLVNKTFLLTQHRLEKGAMPNRDERRAISLQIGERKRASDAYGLIPLFTDVSNAQILAFLGEQLFSFLAEYSFKGVLRRLRQEKDDDRRFYIGSIHAEVVNIVNRIDASGGIEQLEIGSPKLSKKALVFDEDTKEYVRQISKEHFLGKVQTIRGEITKLLPQIAQIEIRRAGGGIVKVWLDAASFDQIRYGTGRSDFIELVGRPRYPIGASSKKFDQFESQSVKVIERDAHCESDQ